jgi:hypothetical protein
MTERSGDAMPWRGLPWASAALQSCLIKPQESTVGGNPKQQTAACGIIDSTEPGGV